MMPEMSYKEGIRIWIKQTREILKEPPEVQKAYMQCWIGYVKKLSTGDPKVIEDYCQSLFKELVPEVIRKKW